MKIYMAGPYTNLSDKERKSQENFYFAIESLLEGKGLDPFIPFIFPDNKELFEDGHPAPEKVYNFCFKHLTDSEWLIAEVSKTSLGIGMELGIAALRGIPVILLYKKGSNVSDFAKGIPGVLIIEYRDEEDCIEKLRGIEF